jgi:hypothetical protein
MSIQIEVENLEIAIKNSHGDIAIIPADKVGWVKRKLAEGCNECIDLLVASLPTNKDYAEDGSVIGNEDKSVWESAKQSKLNPNNWGVDDYTDKYPDKDKEFDGVYGDETKTVLKEWQSKNNKK